MNGISFSLYTNKIFWKKEKALAFFYLLSLALIFSSLLLYCGDSVKKCSFLFCIEGGTFGVLCLSIVIGFFIVWLQSLEERKEDFLILYRLGTGRGTLVLSIQLEVVLFQIAAGIVALLFMVTVILTLREYNLWIVGICLTRLQLELQVISALASCLYMQKRLRG